MAQIAWVIPLLPLLAALFIACFGHRVVGHGDRVGIAGVSVAFILSVAVLADVIGGGSAAGTVTWAVHGETALRLGYDVSALNALMLVIVTFVSLMVHVYSLEYMHGDVRYKRYYAVLSLFTFSMLGLVLADNFLFLFVFWELVGLCSYLLIGHWYEVPDNVRAANKAFLTTRVGDVGMFLGILLLFAATGSFRFDDIASAVAAGQISGVVLTAGAILVFAGAVGKSAQFPLHVWLPDAMAGPTPASALIHAATMVAAGVYLVARAFAIFEPSPTAMDVVTWIGAFTALFAATMAVVMDDIKRVLAYSTVSQLGFMVAALGLEAYTAALFHLTTHAFFKALLFLASGSVIHAVGTQNMHEMGGLFRKLPVTGWTWLVGAGALIGIPPLSGFWSKEEILVDALAGKPAIFWMLLAAAALTAFYTTRATYLTFFGRPRNAAAFAKAHEGGMVMTYPLVILSVLAAGSGFLAGPFSRFIYYGHPHRADFSPFVFAAATIAWVAGTGLAVVMYKYAVTPRRRLVSVFYPIWRLLKQRYYIDDAYNLVFVRGAVGLAGIAAWFDKYVVDGIVNGVAWATGKLSDFVGEFDSEVVDGAVNGIAGAFVAGGRLLRRAQTGFFQSYALVLFVGLVAGLVILVIGG